MSGDSERQEYGAIERRRLLQAAGAGSAIALSGCQGDGGGQTTTTTTQTTTAADDDTDGETTTTAQPELMEDQLDVARPKDFTKINYNRFNPSNFDWGSAGIRWDSLAIWHNGEQAYLPVLAKDWEFTTSKATVNLREGAHWWNGDPLTARDIWAVYWLFGAFNNSEKGAYWGSAGKLLDELKVADETTLEYVFDGEANPFLAKGAVLGDWNARAWINPRREPWKGVG